MKYLGIDIGSISVNTVIINEQKEVVQEFYDFSHGKPFKVLADRLQSIFEKFDDIAGTISFTGTGAKLAAELLDGNPVNEIIAQSKSVMALYPEAHTIIEMGGEDSKLIFLEKDEVKGNTILSDFTMNNLCAAGTGSFLDQQAKRIGVSIDKEFGELALKSKNPPRIAGRCSVFAKSDMIHLQQVATPVYDIVAGLCFAVARNFKSTLGKGKELAKPILFQGGVAANAGMVRAFTEIYNLKEGELIVPKHFASMGAIGAVLYSIDNNQIADQKISLTALENYLNSGFEDGNTLDQLIDANQKIDKSVHIIEGDEKVQAFLGIDVGSLSTNIAIIDNQYRVLARRYLPTASKPLEAIKKGLAEVGDEIGHKVDIVGVGTTGSGRYLTGDFVGADTIQNEITCQATAAIAFDPEVDTIFEIGGQDSKYIGISNGVIVDFEMNKVCAAGTGSFLEEQADKLGVNIKEEFGQIGLSAKKPIKLGERCTVFMESDLNTHQQKGSPKDSLIAGLAYSIVSNYINRVVRDRPIGNKIFFQGGVTNNRAVLAAFQKVTGKPIHVPPHFDITGAIGAAILAHKERDENIKSNFKGFGVSKTNYETDNFECKACSNHCEIKQVKIEGNAKPLFYGGICDKYEFDHNKKNKEPLRDLFKQREEILQDNFENPIEWTKTTIGIPRALMNYYQHFPYWRTFFKQLGFQVVVSDETDRSIITQSLETMVSETCLPVELVHGHVLNLIEKGVDYVFLPFVVNASGTKENPTNNPNCPWVQSHPYLLKAAFTNEKIREKLLIPTLHFRYQKRALLKELQSYFNDKFGIPRSEIRYAVIAAEQEQKLFEQQVKLQGLDVMNNLPKDKKCVVIIGRPYNSGDPSLNLRLVKKLINMDVLPIPLDYLPYNHQEIFNDYPNMYWPNGQKILAGAKYIAEHKNLFAIYLSNFRCGPDSFLLHFVKKEMKGKPFLHLEVDEHSADAGMITRIEAFLDTLKGWEGNGKVLKKNEQVKLEGQTKENVVQRTIYFPYARDTVHMLSAATRSCGIPSEVLPMQTQEDIELGRKYTNGQECFPMIATLGSFLKKLREPGFDPKKASFFMPDHNGPCRFGKYNILQKMIFNDLGYKDAQIINPSNEDAYASIAPGYSVKWRTNTWKGIIASDLLRSMLEQTRPYETVKGKSDEVYQKYLQLTIQSVENNCKNLDDLLKEAATSFKQVPVDITHPKPVVAVVGEVFMRDNPYCSNNLVKRLEDLGAETLMAPFAEWINYSTIRYIRDSKWKGDITNLMKARLQRFFQVSMEKKIRGSVSDIFKIAHDISVEDMLENCGEYIHKDYDGDPPLAIGSAVLMAKHHIAGVVNILPFTCMPGTINCTVSSNLRKDHDGLPWENFAYDGHENIGIDTRFEAFMHQVKEYHQRQLKLTKVL